MAEETKQPDEADQALVNCIKTFAKRGKQLRQLSEEEARKRLAEAYRIILEAGKQDK